MSNSKAIIAKRNSQPVDLTHARKSDRRARLERFLAAYIARVDFDTTKAAIDAGIGEKCARQWAWEAWQDKWFQDQLAAHRERQAETIKIASIEVAKVLWLRAMTSITDIATPEALEAAGVKQGLDPIRAACIKGISSSDASDKAGASRKIEMVPANTWTDQLGKFLGMYQAKVEISGKLDWGAAVAGMPPPSAEELRWKIEQTQKELAMIESQKIAEDAGEY